MRTLTEHAVNPANDKLVVEVMDVIGVGGAHHKYRVTGFDAGTNPSIDASETKDSVNDPRWVNNILFQNGPINDVGVNGLTHEVLLAILADRLRSFQAGPYSCKANACALTHIEEAQHWLQQRTIERMRRGVEGTHTI